LSAFLNIQSVYHGGKGLTYLPYVFYTVGPNYFNVLPVSQSVIKATFYRYQISCIVVVVSVV